MSDALIEVIFSTLDQGVATARSGGPVIPFMVEDSLFEGRTLKVIVAGELQDSVAKARELAATTFAERVAVCFDGYATNDEGRFDAIYVVAQERGGPQAATFFQRYRPADAPGGFESIGNPGFVGMDDKLF